MAASKTILAAGLALALALTAASPPAAAQAAGEPEAAQDTGKADGGKAARELDLKAKELDQIERILDADEEAISKARAEVQILQARIARLLLEKEPPMDKVRALVKESLDWELQVRMAQIERQIAIRKVVGEERWGKVMQYARLAAARAGKAIKSAAADKEAAVLRRVQEILARLK